MNEPSERLARGHLTPGIDAPIATTIRDALYDRIPLSEPELALMDAAPFRRLERIQQLGFVSLIWPGARHVRADHSLGVLHLTRLAVDHLRSLPEGTWIGDEEARVIVAAALLHDIGHYPFSHAIEELGPPISPHEAASRRIIEGPEIAPILRDRWRIEPARVAAVIDPAGRTLPKPDRVLRGLLSGPLDMDKLDYLPRDARACNVPYGGVDAARLIDSLRIAEVARDGKTETRIVIGDKGVSALHSLINARQEMFDNVYWHHANRACMAMLLRAVQDALLARAIRPDALPTFDDRSLLAELAGPAMPESTRRLVRALAERRLHKRGVEFSARAVELYGRLGNLYFDPYARRAVEDRLAAGLAELTGADAPPGSILIDIPKPERWRTDLWVRYDAPPVGFSELMPWRDVVGLADADFKQYEEHRRLIRIVAAAPFREALRQHWEQLLLPLLGGVV
ncbi:MAG TPA: HD domain-containing protein [Thermomicrobiales bacterium]|nr:HD domain-containing protein [Thermomicrobiales bacterium]